MSAQDAATCHGSSEQSDAENQRSAEERALAKRVNRKLDVALLPLLSLLYLFNGLDRSNVGNAETQGKYLAGKTSLAFTHSKLTTLPTGFTADIGATPDDLNLAVSLFFVTFVLFQPPSAAVGRWMGAKNWIPIMMIGWGGMTLVQAWIKGRGALITVRLLVGAFEAGFYPTAVAYLSFFYPKFDLAVRVGLFYGQYAIAGAFSGSISYGIFHLHGPLKNWQYLFIIEGALTILAGLIAWPWLPSGPGSAWFLSPKERRFAVDRIRKDNELYTSHVYSEDGVEKDRLTRRDVIETARDWKLWYVLAFNICASVPGQAFSVFLPLVVQGLGYSSIEANLMSVPPYVCGAAGLYIFALSSDHHKERGYHIVGGICIALLGLIITVTAEHSKTKYGGLCVLLFGSYVSAPLTVAWLSGNTPEPGKRSLVLGVNGFGNLAGVIGAQLYRPKYRPAYKVPFYGTLGFVAAALAGYVAYRFTLARVNARKRRIMSGKTREEIESERTDDTRYADKKWTFIYGL